jgi:hypothetical protein
MRSRQPTSSYALGFPQRIEGRDDDEEKTGQQSCPRSKATHCA